MRDKRKPDYGDTGEIVKVNFMLAYAFAFLLPVGIWVWPDDPRWWGFYILSVLMVCAACFLIIDAMRAIFKVRKARRKLDAMLALGNAPKNAKLANKKRLQEIGMTDV